MDYSKWASLLYTAEEFHQLYELSKGFNDDVNRNHRVRDEKESFSEFIDAGSDALICDHLDLVRQLL